MRIRRARREDAREAYGIYFHPRVNPYMHYPRLSRAAFAKLWEKTRMEKMLFVAVEDGEVMGYAMLDYYVGICSHVAYIGMFAIDPQCHRRGVGRKMIDFLVRKADKDGKRRVELMVEADNPGAISLYSKLGFRKEGTLKRYVKREKEGFVDEHIMAKIL